MTERLTDKNFRLGFDDSNKLPSYEAIYERLRKYETAEEEGRLVVMPCKVGDTVHVLRQSWNGWNIDKKKFTYGMIGKFGKTAFLVREEAEKALKEMDGV